MARTTSYVLFFILATATICFSTDIQFINRCSYAVTVIKTEHGQSPVQECSLNPGQSCQNPYDQNGMNFKNGWNGLTLAEFTFSSFDTQDYYDLNIIAGYDTPMQIAPDTWGPTVTCKGPGCPDAYLYPGDDSKKHETPTGGTFRVTLCP